MAGALFPVFEVPEFTEESAEYDVQYKRSAKWDVQAGDFVRDGANRVTECSGREAFMVWCYKTARTERYACLAYPSDIGVEMEAAMEDDDEMTVESMVERTITDALLVNPRTESVQDFEFSWDGDEMHCRFRVKGMDWEEFITVTI